MAMRWDRVNQRELMRRATPAARGLAPVSAAAPLEEVYRFELECGLILGLVRGRDGEVAYGRYDRSAGRWHLKMSAWMRDEIDYELDRLDTEAAERAEP